MVQLGKGQAIIGGQSKYDHYDNEAGLESKIYYITCSNRIWTIVTLSQELSVARSELVVIPLPNNASSLVSC